MKYIIIAICICIFPSIASAATEYSTFEVFYKDSPPIDWFFAIIGAFLGVVVIICTAGTASPAVAGIGTWIGGTMGLSGAAATNAGLALLGGGSIASGGFGILGGTAVLTAAMAFGTDIVIDYSVGSLYNEYQYECLAEQSKKMTTLPLPVNDSGSDLYKKALEVLSKIDINDQSSISSIENQKVIDETLELVLKDNKSLNPRENSQKESLISMLYFNKNDYRSAKQHSESAIISARLAKIKRTLPAFIYATSSLYDEDFDFEKITQNFFRYSVLAEPDNKFIPLMFSIYLDRMMLRFNDSFLGVEQLAKIASIMTSPAIKEFRTQNYTILMARYFMILKLRQQRISSLTSALNPDIRKSPKTLEVVKQALADYNILASDAQKLMHTFLSSELDREGRSKANEFKALLISYSQDQTRLASLVKDFSDLQKKQLEENTVSFFSYLSLLICLIITVLFIITFHHSPRERSILPAQNPSYTTS